jgi:hypothetical protein
VSADVALRDTWRALWLSRLLVWIGGAGAVLAFGFGPARGAFNPPGVTRGFGALGDLLAAPAARWDASWYLVIAHYGYRPDLGNYTAPRTAFFPLYPLGLRALSELGLPPVLAGVLLSVVALGFALCGIHRLTVLELGVARRVGRRLEGAEALQVARLAVLLIAFAPMAFFLSADYSESLYLALSVGLFLCARRGRWAWVGVLGALAGATRSAGVVLLLPALVLYLYGPREDRSPDRGFDEPRPREDRPLARGLLAPRSRHRLRRDALWFALRPRHRHRRRRDALWFVALRLRYRLGLDALWLALRPRYRLRRDALWLALVPAGVLLYMAYLAMRGGDPLAPFHAQTVWNRHFAGPYLGVWDGARAAFAGLRQLLSFQSRHVYFPAAPGSPAVAASHNLLLFAFLLAALPALAGVLRRLPLAYGLYVLAALALPLSYPVAAQPLMSLSRFLLVLFPLFIWLALWLQPRPRLAFAMLVASGVAMAFFAGEFATWHWVA